MTGYCLVVKKKDEINSVNLIPDVQGIPPVDVIKDYCRKYGVLPFPVDFWDDHAEEIEWFVVKGVEKLEAIKWPDPRNDKEGQVIKAIQIQVYRAFEILQVHLIKALEALDNQVITRALSLDWGPQGLRGTLMQLANAMEENNQAEAYREGIMDMIADVPEAVAATESIYEYAADEFLEEEGKRKSGPKAPKDMTDEELITEATQLHGSIYISDCFGVPDLIRHQALETRLVTLGYEIRVGSEYTVQKLEEE